jgi:hypothetical protein
MDPQKNASSPAPFNPGQPRPSQDDGFQSTSMQSEPPATVPASGQPPEEVTVDFSQEAQNAGQPVTQPSNTFNNNDMPSITSEAPGAVPPPTSGGIPGQAFSQPPTGGAIPDAGFNPASQPGGPAQPAGMPDQGPTGFDAPAQPGNPAIPGAPQGFGAAQPGPEQSQPQPAAFMDPNHQPTVPATAPTPGIKADKKTIMILAAVAVVLIAAIAVLIFM